MNAAQVIRDASAKTAALYQYAAAHDRFSEAEQVLVGRGCHLVASLAHGYALIALRAYRAELDDPQPQGLVG